jgi:glycosyltransferase involved in cell wall biosynthesis
MSPLFSVCIPTYNGGKYLRECLDSIVAQTFADFEVLVVDDRSSDDTVAIAGEYAARDQRFRVIGNEHNLGAVRNWNKCISLATGEWVKFVFQDDLIAPCCLEQFSAVCAADRFMIACRRNFLFEAGTPDNLCDFYLNHLSSRDVFAGATTVPPEQFCCAVLDHLGENLVGEPTVVALHRNTFERFGTFNPALTMVPDVEFWTRVGIHVGIILIPQSLATFRVHAASLSAHIFANQSHRANIIDPIAISRDFAFGTLYAPLRTAAQAHEPPIDLWALAARQAIRGQLWFAINHASIDTTDLDPSLLQDWTNHEGYDAVGKALRSRRKPRTPDSLADPTAAE